MAARQDDLTGAPLVVLLRLSLAAQGIALPDDAPRPRPNRAHASLSAKAALAEWVLAEHGPAPLLCVGQAVPMMRDDPIGASLLAAPTAPDLIARWVRLERYVHTAHPLVFREVDARGAVAVHEGDAANPPGPAVDFLLAGVLAGLMAAVTRGVVDLTIGEDASACEAISGNIVRRDWSDLPHPTGIWRFRWRAASREASPAGLDEPAERAAEGRLTRIVGAEIARDLLQSHNLATLAASVGCSARTLQRRLADDGLSVQAIRRRAQIRQATCMLRETDASLVAIGFACGFSDAAHFTRCLRAATGMSPSAYRQFARIGAAPD